MYHHLITTDYAVLDVKVGRAALARHFEDRPPLGPCPVHLRVPVTIVGYIDDCIGTDDGISNEFSMVVEEIWLRKIA